MVGSKCSLKMHVRNLEYPFLLQIGGPKTTFFGQLRNLMATLTAYPNDTRCGESVKCVDNYKGLLHRPKMS